MKPAREQLRWLARFGRRRLSKEVVFRKVYSRLCDAFDQMIGDASAGNLDDERCATFAGEAPTPQIWDQ